jgi:predicted RNase H-like HicB family nuclease
VGLSFTAVYRKVPEGYIAFVEELPCANAQAETLQEARANLREAVELVIQASRELCAKELQGADVIREKLELSA